MVGIAMMEKAIGKKLTEGAATRLAPCPLLVYDKDAGRVWCRIGLDAADKRHPWTGLSMKLGECIGFGVGCDSQPEAEEMNNADNLYINADGFIKHKSL